MSVPVAPTPTDPPRPSGPAQPSGTTGQRNRTAGLSLPISLDPVSELVVGETVILRPYVDPLVDRQGYDPRSSYVELFWLGVLGPSSVWLLRRLAAGFDAWPDGFELDVQETADALGLAAGHRNSTFTRTLMRIVSFNMGRVVGDGIEVRRRLPPLSARHLARLPPSLRQAHHAWAAAGHGDDAERREHERAHAAAAGLLGIGDEPELVERQLLAMGIRPHVAARAVAWALGQVHHPGEQLPSDAA